MFGSVVSPTQSWVFVPIIRESLRLAGHNLQQSAAEQRNAQSVRNHIGGQLWDLITTRYATDFTARGISLQQLAMTANLYTHAIPATVASVWLPCVLLQIRTAIEVLQRPHPFDCTCTAVPL